MNEDIQRELRDSAGVLMRTAENLAGDIAKAAETIIESYKNGGKVLFAGNGGSAADAQHLAAELVSKFLKERAALSAIALSTDTSILTAITNDYGPETMFSRQVEAHGREGDILFAITTSGMSLNILKAAEVAKSKGLKVIGLTGRGGGKLKDLCDIALIVPSDNTQRIQEVHTAIGHILCGLIEEALFD